MNRSEQIPILPYSLLVGQEQLRLALELAYISPSIGGVLITGERGTGKSTAVRAFAQMIYNRLPVTLPINATEDRVVGGWYIDKLINLSLLQQPDGTEQAKQPGLIEKADQGLLFIDEVNLLDDHIVNIILDVTATGILTIEREARSEEKRVAFTLVGTMNPEEGWLRQQFLDRFGLIVSVTAETDEQKRTQILKTVIDFDRAVRQSRITQNPTPYLAFIADAQQKNTDKRSQLETARQSVDEVEFPDAMTELCVKVAKAFKVVGHRADYIMALAARAYAALEGDRIVAKHHLQTVAPLAVTHRRQEETVRGQTLWTTEDDEMLHECLGL